MVLFNYSTKELTAKVVYYGPGLCGKTTNLQYVHENLPSTVKGKMLSLATKTDRTLFFDFLPLDLGTIRGMKTRIQLYTVPGQVFYNETRKLVLKGADGIVFVADSQEQMLQANVESFRNLEENLKTHGMNLAEMPHVLQFNKRDLPKIASVEEMNAAINRFNAPFYESVATTGIGVQDTLKAITKLVLLHLTKKYDPKTAARSSSTNPPSRPSAPAPAPGATGAPIPVAASAPPLEPAPAPVEAAAPPPTPERSAPPPPPNFHGPAADEPAAPRFADQELDDFLGEVEEPVLSPFPVPDGVEDEPAAADVAGSLPETPPPEPADSEAVPVSDDAAFVEQPVEDTPVGVPIDDGDAVPVAALSDDDDDDTPFEIDPSFGTDDAEGIGIASTAAASTVEPTPPPFEFAEQEVSDAPTAAEPDDAPIELTEIADDRSLFEDPGLDVARLATGHAKEIVVPVELRDGTGVRRFKLSVTLKLDPVD